MAHDDMHVLMYKVLAYLYSCMKSGREPDSAALKANGPIFEGVPESYRTKILMTLVERGYVTGIDVDGVDNARFAIPIDPEITFEGVEFMMENTMMRKALKFLQDAKSALPFI